MKIIVTFAKENGYSVDEMLINVETTRLTEWSGVTPEPHKSELKKRKEQEKTVSEKQFTTNNNDNVTNTHNIHGDHTYGG